MCFQLWTEVLQSVLTQKYHLRFLSVDYETTQSNLPPVSSEDLVVLTQPTTPSGADLRHINIHYNTGVKLRGRFWSHCLDGEELSRAFSHIQL